MTVIITRHQDIFCCLFTLIPLLNKKNCDKNVWCHYRIEIGLLQVSRDLFKGLVSLFLLWLHNC